MVGDSPPDPNIFETSGMRRGSRGLNLRLVEDWFSREARMTKQISAVLSAVFLLALFMDPVVPSARAAGGGGGGDPPAQDINRPTPPAKRPRNTHSNHPGRKAGAKQSLFDDPAF